jgi:tRNA(Ile)-lysidine synthase
VVGFSGGPDSTALLWALTRLAARRPLPLLAAHLDHALDPASGNRAEHARRMAAELGVAFASERRRPDGAREGIEAAARRERYAFLERCRDTMGAGAIAVGHHRDDQIATILMRILFGSGLTGLGGMRPARGAVLRPLLALDRRRLVAALAQLGLPSVADPGNDDLARPRNRIEASLVPWLATQPGGGERLLAVAAAAERACDRVRARLVASLGIESLPAGQGARLRRAGFEQLPAALRTYALDALRRAAGAPYPPPRGARRELDRQLAGGGGIGCHCGDGWGWRATGPWLEMSRPATREVRDFSYTLRVPGEVFIPEVGLTLHVEEGVQAPWMFQGSKSRAAMSLPLEVGQKVLIRNRRPGDRVRPLGCAEERKLKDVLIDKHVGRAERAALPLLVVGGRIAWVPGVTIDERFRLTGNRTPWIADLIPSKAGREL